MTLATTICFRVSGSLATIYFIGDDLPVSGSHTVVQMRSMSALSPCIETCKSQFRVQAQKGEMDVKIPLRYTLTTRKEGNGRKVGSS